MEKREIKWWELDSMSEDVELLILDKFCQEVFDEVGGNTNVAIEIGSYKGKTTAIIAQYFRHVIAIDLFGDLLAGTEYKNLIGTGFKIFIDAMKHANLIEIIHPVVSTSIILETLPNLEADLAFVDGDHHREAALLDLERVKRHITRKGLIILHDFERPSWGYDPLPGEPMRDPVDPWHGVSEAVHEFLGNNEDFELYAHERGVGVLRRK